MITPGEISRAVFGAWNLARFNANGITLFDNTAEAFWRSFWAAAIVLPAYAILVSLRFSGGTIGVGAGTAFYVHCVSYAIEWLAFPFAAYYAAEMFNRGQWYCRYIVAFNWSAVLQTTLLLVVGLIAIKGLIPPIVGYWATVIVLIFVLTYKGFIAYTALQSGWAGAAGIVFMDFCLDLIIDGWSDRLLQVQRAASG